MARWKLAWWPARKSTPLRRPNSHCERPLQSWKDAVGDTLLPGEGPDTLIMETHQLNDREVNFLNSGQPGTPDNPSPSSPTTMRLYFVGCIDYFDEFKGPHRTRFCYFFDPITSIAESRGSFRACFRGNSAD